MNFAHLPMLEKNFLASGNNSEYNIKRVNIPIQHEPLQLDTVLVTPKNKSGYYYSTEHPKKRIVLHYTAGNLQSDIGALTKNDYHVSVPFVIARDGTIYQLFSSKLWSGHLGKGLGNTGTGNAEDKCSIGIEISNYGFLEERDGNLETYYSRQKDDAGRIGPVDVYCARGDQKAYIQLDAPFRNENFFAAYTEEQYNSLIILLRYLTTQYTIPREFLPEPLRYQATNEVLNFNGIVSHINYRIDGKWDIGPAFNWKKVIEGVRAAAYIPTVQPALQKDVLANGLSGTPLSSEEEMGPFLPLPADPASEDEPYEEVDKSEMEAKERKKKLYAVLVGINNYKENVAVGNDDVYFPRLSGCVSDASKVESYLSEDKSFDQHILVLKNSEATKPAIVDAIKDHLGKAKENDVAFFYFSGHGTQEYANKAFAPTETDNKLESIACYYTEETKNNFLLADKELRWLISRLAKNKPHIVTLFDCCHSGDNTRNAGLLNQSFPTVVEKRVPYVFPERNWDAFIFNNEFTPEQVAKDGTEKLIPEGHHFQISACESDESAVEIGGEGVFTKVLLRILNDAGGDITYYSLGSRLRQYMRNVYEQKSKIYVASGQSQDIYTPFLNKSLTETSTTFGEITAGPENTWLLNRGAIHGINKNISTLDVFDPDNPAQIIKAKIRSVGVHYSEVVPEKKLNSKKIYRAHTGGLASGSLHLYFDIARGALPEQQQVFDTLLKQFGNLVIPEDNEQEAQYSLQLRNGRYYLTHPGDPYRPVAEPIEANSENPAPKIAAYIKHIADWEFLKNLVNQDKNTLLTNDGLKVEIAVGQDQFKPIQDAESLTINYVNSDGTWVNSLRIRLTNSTQRNLYCSCLYLLSTFKSFTEFLNPQVYLLEPGNTVDLNFEGEKELVAEMDEVMKWYNWSGQKDYLQFIAATEPFDVTTLSFDALPSPPVPGAGRELTRGLKTTSRPSKIKGWFTKRIEIISKNPEYNRIGQDELSLLLNDEQTADFALGLYFDGCTDNLAETHELKKEIEITGATKGLVSDKLIDLANWWSRRKRNRWYHTAVSKFPNRVKIVSEGDSWFQHPLVLDIIDHLQRVFNIYCVAAAGDTLRNYFSKEKNNGVFYLDALEECHPRFFLISGGGNDILGSQFRNYLTDTPDNKEPEGTNPARFLKQELFKEMDSLMELYDTTFSYLQTFKPDLHIIVHGYDYPVKLNDAKKGWLGRYMIEKGISRPGDRQAIIHFIMDEFNVRLSGVCAHFKNTVTYIDVRNIVRFDGKEKVDQWYDEIHPNNDGFQQIAMKFIQVITGIAGAKPQPADDQVMDTVIS